jgi:hypothetical protein
MFELVMMLKLKRQAAARQLAADAPDVQIQDQGGSAPAEKPPDAQATAKGSAGGSELAARDAAPTKTARRVERKKRL